jgi:hypothetical protein
LYWEGAPPGWIKECHRTVFFHAADVRLLGPSDFDDLRDVDRDISLARLHVAQRADYIRAFLLARYGGLWIDSDCIVMKPLQPLLDQLQEYDFLAHRERTAGLFCNALMGARPGSQIAAAFYRQLCEILRSGRNVGWTDLGCVPLTATLRSTDVAWREIDCDLIQPICWSEPGAFFAVGSRQEHEHRMDPRAICYMLSNLTIQKETRTADPSPELLAEGTFFRFLLRQALKAQEPASAVALRPSNNGFSHLPFCIEAMVDVAPKRVLELGTGIGRWGMLVREFCEASGESWRVELEGVALSPERIAAQHHALYSSVRYHDRPESVLANVGQWNLVIFGEEFDRWPAREAAAVLRQALDRSDYVLVNTRLGPGAPMQLDDFRDLHPVRYAVTEKNHGQDWGAFLLSRHDPNRLQNLSQGSRVFEQMHWENVFAGGESVSGPGSSLEQTAEIRQRLPLLIADLDVKSLLDLPCGDFNWMRHVGFGVDDYIGGDIVPQLIENNRQLYAAPHRRFMVIDLLHQLLPRVDLILCRDCLVHFSFAEITTALKNFKRSGSSYLLTTMFTSRIINTDIATGDWRTLNFQLPPFSFPPPLRVIVEKCSENGGQYGDKSLGLWRLGDLPV